MPRWGSPGLNRYAGGDHRALRVSRRADNATQTEDTRDVSIGENDEGTEA